MSQEKEGFVIVANSGKPLAMKVKKEMSKWLVSQGQTVIEEERRKMSARFVISLGGDGTAIHTVSKYSVHGVVTVPLNVGGGVGFVTIGNANNWKMVLKKIISGNFMIEKRLGLELLYKGKKYGPFANDVVLKQNVSMTTFRMKVDDQVIYKGAMADGFIISAPTGSTGYNLSAKGPVVVPGQLECILVTPMYPDQFNIVPLVMNYDVAIEISILDSKSSGFVELIADGNKIGKVSVGEEIIVRKHKEKLLFAAIDRKHFFKALQTKKGLAK